MHYLYSILDFILSDRESPKKILGIQVTWLELCFREITLNEQGPN